MDRPSASIERLAKRLLAIESRSSGASHAHEAVWRKLGVSLSRFAGEEGCTSLLRRALSLAQKEVPSLQPVSIAPDASLIGLDTLPLDSTTGGPEGATAITAYLLALLVTFIGEPLTLRLVREAWPGSFLDDEHSESEVVP